MDYKDTLLMPKTEFKMRGGLATKEPEIQKWWHEIDLHDKIVQKNRGNQQYILHDGPPYANGPLHMGHALNKVIKDIINRKKVMTGYDVRYVPGWDTHGLPIEQSLINQGVKKENYSHLEFREKCSEFANTQVELQKKGFIRMGIYGEWNDPYITSNPIYEAEQVRILKEMVAKGLIYKGKKPIYWSPISESSLAEAELEYIDKRSPSIYVGFEVTDGKGIIKNGTKLVIWTTTPWTIPSNLAIAVHPEIEYLQFEYDGELYIVASNLFETITLELGWDISKTAKSKAFKGADLEYIEARNPLYDRKSLVILGDHVTLESGTGLVHTAPGHGEDDYVIGRKYGLDVLSPIDDKGRFTNEAGKYEGLFYDDANKVITDDLKEVQALLKLKFITHSYPHDWRTKTPVIMRATPQWFASVENIKEDILKEILKTKFHFDWNKRRMYNMIENRGDWVISRQRVWGVPLPFFYAESGEEIVDVDVIEHVAKLFAEHGTNIWYTWEANDLLPKGFSHPGSPNGTFKKEKDIMDVWFDSGSSHRAVLGTRDYLKYPADLYFEGSDQYRGWFNSSIITSVAANGSSPYKELLSHGFVMDGEGKKMSKSLGNVILPEDVMNQMGADIVRLWVMSSDFSEDVRVSDDILKQVSEVYRKVRNTFRFLLGNLYDFNPRVHSIQYEELFEVDKYIYNKFNHFLNECLDNYDNYDYVSIYQLLQNFINIDLSSFYFDYGKDILYIEKEDSKIRRSIQTVLYKILTELNFVLAPILVHTSEEIYKFTPHTSKESVHLENIPERQNIDYSLLDKWVDIMTIRNCVYRVLEESRKNKEIGKSLDAKVTMTLPEHLNEGAFILSLPRILIVSQVEVVDDLVDGVKFDKTTVLVSHAEGLKCQRCWNYTKDESIMNGASEVCDRCEEILINNY